MAASPAEQRCSGPVDFPSFQGGVKKTTDPNSAQEKKKVCPRRKKENVLAGEVKVTGEEEGWKGCGGTRNERMGLDKLRLV